MKRDRSLPALLAVCLLSSPAFAAESTSPAVIGRSVEQSTPAFPQKPRPPAGAPNVLLVLTDDVGFGAAGTFGGLIPTPSLDEVAATGYRLNNFHTTAMCSPTRAALLTGRNAHNAGVGALSDMATGFPGYYGEISRATATVAETLRATGYRTAFFGKHHSLPLSESSTAGPFSSWPTNLGFEYFYGFIGGQTDQWAPALIRGTSRAAPVPGEHLDRMLADDAIRWIQEQKGRHDDAPFFMYFAPGTAHAPLQAPREWIERFKGKFDRGWDALREEIFERQKAVGVIPASATLTSRPSFIPAFSSLSPKEKAVATRLMEVYAAQLAHQDNQFGRLVDALRRMGELDNTLIIFIQGDNGASSEGGLHGTTNHDGHLVNAIPEDIDWLHANLENFGGPDVHAHYPMGWAWAMNTPFQYFKRIASHLGGIRNGTVVSWPARLNSDGELRTQFHHVIDVVPTILEAVGVSSPQEVNGVPQKPLDGVSMLPSLAHAERLSGARVQYFELLGNRALYKDGWLASTLPPASAVEVAVASRKSTPSLAYDWALYDLTSDFSQSRDLAKRYPERLEEMKAIWWREAERNQVLPLDNNMTPARIDAEPMTRLPARQLYTYWGTGAQPERGSLPPILSRSFTLKTKLDIPSADVTGVVAAVGNHMGGWSFYLKDGKPVAYQAFSDQPAHKYRLAAEDALKPGSYELSFEVEYPDRSREAVVSIMVDGEKVASDRFPHRINMVVVGEALTFGYDGGGAVSDDYQDGGHLPLPPERVDIIFAD